MSRNIPEPSSMRCGVARLRLLCTAVLLVIAAGCATTDMWGQKSPANHSTRTLLRETWGIEVASLHLSAHGRIVDFRYRVLDPKKAALLGNREVKPILTDLATGTLLRVPSFPKTGSMRQTTTQLEAGRTYFMLFANTGMAVKTGSRVTISIGDFKAEGLIVQ